MKNASASGSSKSQMLPSSLPLPASFFTVLSLPQKFNRFQLPLRIPLPVSNPTSQTELMIKAYLGNLWLEFGFHNKSK